MVWWLDSQMVGWLINWLIFLLIDWLVYRGFNQMLLLQSSKSYLKTPPVIFDFAKSRNLNQNFNFWFPYFLKSKFKFSVSLKHKYEQIWKKYFWFSFWCVFKEFIYIIFGIKIDWLIVWGSWVALEAPTPPCKHRWISRKYRGIYVLLWFWCSRDKSWNLNF